MKKVKLDVLDRMKAFEDTPQVVEELRLAGEFPPALHLEELWTLTKKLAAEVRKLRKGEK